MLARESICRAAEELDYPVVKPEQLEVLPNVRSEGATTGLRGPEGILRT